MKRIIALTLVLLLTMISGVGCSMASQGSVSGNTKILYIVADGTDVFRTLIASGAQEYADANQISLTVVDAAKSIETQIQQIKSAKSEGYTAIICNLVNSDIANLAMTSAEGLPIVFINQNIDSELLQKNKYIYVGSDENVAGNLQAEFLVNYFKGKGLTSVNAVLFEGEKGHPAALGRTEAVKKGLKEAGIDVTYVFQDRADWSREKTQNMFTTFLNTNREFDCIICNNDEMALGAIEACKARGIDPSSIPIVGVDGTKDGCNAIVDKTMSFSIFQSAGGQGKAAVEAAVALGNGGKITNIEYAVDDKYIWVPYEGITADNVQDYIK